MSDVLILNDANFDSTINNESRPVLVVFYAPWCGYCRMQLPILRELADIMEDKAVIAEINIDNNAAKAREFSVSGVPSLYVFKNGKVVYHQSGVHKADDLKRILEKSI